MVAYVIAIREKTTDSDKLKEYAQHAMASLAGRSFKAHVAYGRIEVLEGDSAEGATILEFPTFEAAKAWYDSPANQRAMLYRKAGARYRLMILDGI